MIHERTVNLPEAAKVIKIYTEGHFDVPVKERIEFDDGKKLEILYHCDDSWAEGILYDNKGREIQKTEPRKEFFGKWCFTTANGDMYVAVLTNVPDTEKPENENKE